MPFTFPLRVKRHVDPKGAVVSYTVTDARGRSVCVYCEQAELRREVAKLWTPAEAEAIAVWVARRLTNDWAEQVLIHQNAAGEPKRTKG